MRKVVPSGTKTACRAAIKKVYLAIKEAPSISGFCSPAV